MKIIFEQILPVAKRWEENVNGDADVLQIAKENKFEELYCKGYFLDGNGEGTLFVGLKDGLPTRIKILS